jgi:hypothetical protein
MDSEMRDHGEMAEKKRHSGQPSQSFRDGGKTWIGQRGFNRRARHGLAANPPEAAGRPAATVSPQLGPLLLTNFSHRY